MASAAAIDLAIKAVARTHYGFGGNCATFAFVLNRMFGGDGSYLIVESGHYEFADHVLVNIRGRLFDADGMVRRADVRSRWCGDGERLETFYDPSPDGCYVLGLAGEGFGAKLDAAKLEAALRTALASAPSGAEAAPPPSSGRR